MIYFTRHEQRIIIFLGVLILLGTGVLMVKRFQPGWFMRLTMGSPDFDVERDEISPRLKKKYAPSGTAQGQQPDRGEGGEAATEPVDTRRKEERQQPQDIEDDVSTPSDESKRSYQLDRHGGGGGSGVSLKARININTATKRELESLPGIGPVLAERIIRYREDHKEQGGFTDIYELTEVRGIGDKTLRRVRELITVGDLRDKSTP